MNDARMRAASAVGQTVVSDDGLNERGKADPSADVRKLPLAAQGVHCVGYLVDDGIRRGEPELMREQLQQALVGIIA
jgi:hypothetical protein